MNVEIAQRLATMRREQGYSQEELAERLGLSRQAVSKWERAESSPDIGNIVALAKLYGVTVDELLRVEDDLDDDMQFEERDRSAAAEAEAQQAAVRANEAAVRAAQAAVAAAQARATAEQAQAQAQVPPGFQPAPQAGSQPAPQPTSQSQAPAMPQPQVPPTPTSQPVTGSQPQMPPAPQSAPMPQPAPAQPYASYTPPAPQQPAPFAAPQPPADTRTRRGPWMTFPYPILCVIVFLFIGFFDGLWHPAWVIFLTIPLYYWIAHIIENDPNYRADHERRG